MAEGVRTTDFPLLEAADSVVANDESAGGSTGRLPVNKLAEQLTADGPLSDRLDAIEDLALSGARAPVTVKVIAASNVAIASGLENGDTVDGVVMATGDVVLLTAQTTASQNGAYVVVASGAASRDPRYNEGNELVGAQFAAAAGTNTGWIYAVRDQPVIGTDAIVITRAFPTNVQADGSVTPAKLAPQAQGTAVYRRPGAGEGSPTVNPLALLKTDMGLDGVFGPGNIATAAETIAGTATDKVVSPAGLTSRFGGVIDFDDSPPAAVLAVGKRSMQRVYATVEKDGTFSPLKQRNHYRTDIPGVSWMEHSDDGVMSRVVRAARDGGMYTNGVVLATGGDDGGGGEINPDIVIPVLRPTSPCASYVTPEGRRYWILGGRMGSWWVRGNWQLQNDFYSSGVSPLPIRWDQRVDNARGRLLGYQMLRGSGNFECVEVGQDIDGSGVDDHDKFAYILDPRTNAIFPVMVQWTNHGSIQKRMWYSNSRDLKGLGPQVTVTTDSNYTYMQPFRRFDNLDEIWSWSRQSDGSGVFWGPNISTNNGRTWSNCQRVFSRVDHYLNAVPRRDGQGFRCFHHVNPSTGSVGNDIKMTTVNYDGTVRSYLAGVLGNFKDAGYTPINVFTSDTDIIVDPAPSTHRVRMTSAVEVATNVYHLGYIIGEMATADSHMANARAMVAIVDCTAAVEGSVPPVVTTVDLGPAGKNLSTFEAAPYNDNNKTYLGGVTIVGTAANPNLALVAANDRDNDGKSYLELIDYSNPSLLKKRTVREVASPTAFGRPEVYLKVNYDGTNIWYDNGDLCEAWFGRYRAFAFFLTDGITIPTADWIPA